MMMEKRIRITVHAELVDKESNIELHQSDV